MSDSSPDEFELTDDLLDGYDALTPYEVLVNVGRIVERAEASDPDYDYLVESFKPVFTETVDADALDAAEARLGVTLPPSYRAFVLEHGLFKVGDANDEAFRMLAPDQLGRLSDALAEQWSVDWDTYSAEQKARVDNIVYFSMGDEQLQLVWYYCFDFNTRNPDTGEVEVVAYKQGLWQWMLDADEHPTFGTDGGTTMHAHAMCAATQILEHLNDEMQ